MVLIQYHLRKVTDSNSVNKPFLGCSQQLNSVLTRTQPVHCSEELSLHESLAVVLVMVEKHHLAISTSHAQFVTGHRLDASHSLSAHVLSKNKHLILDLEAHEISRSGSSKQELFRWLRKGQTTVLSHISAS